MPRVLRSVAGRIGNLLVAALALTSVLASGHHHSADQVRPPDSCALCMVKSDSPAVKAAPVPQLAPALCGFALAPVSTAKPGSTYRPFKAGRGPPLRAPIHAA